MNFFPHGDAGRRRRSLAGFRFQLEPCAGRGAQVVWLSLRALRRPHSCTGGATRTASDQRASVSALLELDGDKRLAARL
eukprot:3290843-Prymnesium_polylepis.1